MMRWTRSLLFLCVFGFSLGISLWFTSAQTLTKPQIAFVSTREDHNTEIYVVDSDGTNVRRLTHHPAEDGKPCWSPDGKQIAFGSWRDDDPKIPGLNSEIYVMDSDGTNVRRLTHHLAEDGSPCWSPDGKQIAFVSNRDGNYEIYVMNSDGTNPRNLTQHPSNDWWPDWSPDGKHIAFTSDRSRFEPLKLEQRTDIFVMDSDGKNLRNLTKDPGWAMEDQPCWSPDGKQIAFWSNRDGNIEIYVMDSDGKNLLRITDHPALDEAPCWSSDGKQIVFTSRRDGNPDIYVMNSNGGNPKRLTDHPKTDEYPRWFDPAFAKELPVSRAGKLPSTWGRWKAMP